MDELIEYESNDNQNNLSVGCHLLGFLGFVFPIVGNIVAPLVLWLVKRDGNPFVDEQGKEAVNFQISYSLWYVIGGALITALFWTLVVPIVVGIAMAVLAILWVVTMIIAAVRASRGEGYRYPFTLRLLT